MWITLYELIAGSLLRIIASSRVTHACDTNSFSSVVFMPMITLNLSASLKIIFKTAALIKQEIFGKNKLASPIDFETEFKLTISRMFVRGLVMKLINLPKPKILKYNLK